MMPPSRPISFTCCFFDLNGTHAGCTEPVSIVLQNARVTLIHAGRSFANDMEIYLESAHALEKHGHGGLALIVHVLSKKGHRNVGTNPMRLVSANAGGGDGGGGEGGGGGLGLVTAS
mmetsp:Transcript_10810/g.26431  ORF Transcript_10810/g.26431 Transcript_10810/m.26431 type:complete len:117 (-) Transcript_10810:314-664(-)